MTTRDHQSDGGEVLEEVRKRIRQARRDQIEALKHDIDDADLPRPTHYSDKVH